MLTDSKKEFDYTKRISSCVFDDKEVIKNLLIHYLMANGNNIRLRYNGGVDVTFGNKQILSKRSDVTVYDGYSGVKQFCEDYSVLKLNRPC